MSDADTLPSTIPGSTPAELHLVVRSDNSLVWNYRNAAGQLVALGDDTLIAEYDNVTPATEVKLRIVNVTAAPIDIEVVAHGDATVTPEKPHRFVGEYTWTCLHNGGTPCDCASGRIGCGCASWSVKGAPTPGGVVIPDPTFKVRWQARTNEPSSS